MSPPGAPEPEPKMRYGLIRAPDVLELVHRVNEVLKRDDRNVVVGGPCVATDGFYMQAMLVSTYE